MSKCTKPQICNRYSKSDAVLMAIIGKTYSVSGEVRIKSFSENLFSFNNCNAFHDESGVLYYVASFRRHKENIFIVRFLGIDSCQAAKSLSGTRLFLKRAQLPDSLDKDEFYQHDLLGFYALSSRGVIGNISAFFDFGGGPLIELVTIKNGKHLIPFSKSAVLEIDTDKQYVLIDITAAGLDFLFSSSKRGYFPDRKG